MKLLIGNKNYSSWSLRAWLLLAHHAIPFEEVRIPLSVAETSALIAKHSRAGKVPVLEDEGVTVWDSLAICEYVSEKYLHGGGWPIDVTARAEARSCSAEMHSGFFALRGQMPMNCRAAGRQVAITAELARDIIRMDEMWNMMRSKYKDAGPWLFGGFSIADCMFAPVVFRFATYAIAKQADISETARVYMDTVLSHPAVEQWRRQAHAEKEIIEEEEVGLP